MVTAYEHIIDTWSTDDSAGNQNIITVYQHIINTWSTDDPDYISAETEGNLMIL